MDKQLNLKPAFIERMQKLLDKSDFESFLKTEYQTTIEQVVGVAKASVVILGLNESEVEEKMSIYDLPEYIDIDFYVIGD